MAHVTTQIEETSRQLQRCVKLRTEFAQRRRELRRECERQRSATRHVAARLELLERRQHS